MWEDNRKKRLFQNIILILLILIIVSALGIAVVFVRQQTREHDEQLSEIYVEQKQQETEARQESVTAIQREYEKDMQTVADYLPGIVCWGDSLTFGSAGNISYPSVLQTYLDTYFCDIYDFRSTIENAADYSRLKWEDYKVSVPVVNLGAGPENSYTVLGRSGVVPFVLGADIDIPGEKEPVEIMLASESGREIMPLSGGNDGINNVRIGDVVGTLTIDPTSQIYGTRRYYFTRLEEGGATWAPAGTVVETAASSQYKDYIHVVCIGTYGTFDSIEDLVQQTKALLARQTQNTDRYLVLGLCSYNSSRHSTYYLDALDTAMMQAFGNHYVNVRKYLVEDGIADAGISPSQQDKNFIASGVVPVAFTTSNSSLELNGKAYQLIGKLVYSRMESLGYFDEVFEELGIKETTKQILKDDPEYFERIIKNMIK